MRKPGTNEDDVRMSDVLCDYCRREWTEDVPMVEGHQGACICGNCLTLAYAEVVVQRGGSAPPGFACRMCLETGKDREALSRTDESGWCSPIDDEACICRRCIKLGSGALVKDPDSEWKKPAE
jgi:hypothetical protein